MNQGLRPEFSIAFYDHQLIDAFAEPASLLNRAFVKSYVLLMKKYAKCQVTRETEEFLLAVFLVSPVSNKNCSRKTKRAALNPRVLLHQPRIVYCNLQDSRRILSVRTCCGTLRD